MMIDISYSSGASGGRLDVRRRSSEHLQRRDQAMDTSLCQWMDHGTSSSGRQSVPVDGRWLTPTSSAVSWGSSLAPLKVCTLNRHTATANLTETDQGQRRDVQPRTGLKCEVLAAGIAPWYERLMPLPMLEPHHFTVITVKSCILDSRIVSSVSFVPFSRHFRNSSSIF